MSLVDVNGNPVDAKKIHERDLVSVTGEKLSSEEPKAHTTVEIGQDLAKHMIDSAGKSKTNEEVNKQFDVLYHAALNILAHRILNVGLGMEVGNAIAEWNPSRAFAQEKTVQEDLTTKVDEWKNMFFNGELYFDPGKPV